METHLFTYYTHYCSDAVMKEFLLVRDALPENFDLVVSGYNPETFALDRFRDSGAEAILFSRQDLETLPYKEKLRNANWATTRGSGDLVPCAVFRKRPYYDYYWFLEYDVRFSGKWRDILALLSETSADLLCVHINKYADKENWSQWDTIKSSGSEIDKKVLLGGFMPFLQGF